VAVSLLQTQPFVFSSASIPSLTPPAPAASIAADPATANSVAMIVPNSTLATSVVASPTVPSTENLPIPTRKSFQAMTPSRAARGMKIWSTAASPDGRLVLRTTTDRNLVLTNRETGREFDLSSEAVTAVAFIPESSSFLAAGSDGRVTLWDGETGKIQRTILEHDDGLRSIAVSPAGDAVAVGGRDGAILLHELASGLPLVDLPGFTSSVNCVRFSPDGRQLAVATGDWMIEKRGDVTLLNIASGQTAAKMTCTSPPGAVSFASNDELIIGFWNGKAELWNLNSVQVVGAATTDKNIVAAAAFSPDNPVLREIKFEAMQPTEFKNPFTLLQEFLGNP
jgi:WD40 repeat protein